MPRDPFSRWRYSTRILFSGCDQEVYQQDLVIHRTAGRDHEEEAGGLKVWHIFIGPKCRPDYGDLRFADQHGRELSYYLEPGFDGASARFCVLLESADISGTLVVHYGNATAKTTSGDDPSFHLFDGIIANPSFEVAGSWVYSEVTAGTGDGSNGTLPSSDWASAGSKSAYIYCGYSSMYSGHYYAQFRQTVQLPPGQYVLVFDRNGSQITAGKGYMAVRIDNVQRYFSRDPGVYLSQQTEMFTATGSGTEIVLRNGVDVSGGVRYASGYWDNLRIRASSASPPSLLRSTRGVNPSYAGLARLTGSAAADDGVIQFAGVGSILVVGDEREAIAGAGSFAIETSVRSSIPIAGAVGLQMSLHLVPAPATPTGAGGVISEPARLHTPLGIEAGEGSAYVAPTPVQFDLTKYRFSSLTISRSAQDALWRCEGRIVGLDAPLAYKQFEVRVPDHNGVLRTLFVGFVPGRDYVRAVTADESIIQGYDAGFYLTRQYLPDGNLTYPRVFGWGPARLLHYFLGEEGVNVYSRSRWEQITGIMPYRLENPPSYYEWPYSSRIDWVFQPKTTKAQAIQEICEKSGLVFLVKWRKIHGAWTPCAYLVPEEDIDHPTRGLDLPDPVTFTHPDPHVMNYVRVTMRSDEKYNRIEVRSASPSGAWFHAVRETPALRAGEELPIEYLEERSDLPIDADHGGWCNARADELYAYYTKYAYTYTLTLINRVDLELYQRCRFYGFDAIPSGEMMRIIAITYNVLPTHTEVEITVTPDSRLSDLRRLQRSQAADAVSEMQVIARSQIEGLAAGEIGTVIEIDGGEAVVELERKAGSTMRGRIIT